MNQRNRLDEHFSEAAQLLVRFGTTLHSWMRLKRRALHVPSHCPRRRSFMRKRREHERRHALRRRTEQPLPDDRPGLPAISAATKPHHVRRKRLRPTRSSPDSGTWPIRDACSPFPQVATVPTYSKQPKPPVKRNDRHRTDRTRRRSQAVRAAVMCRGTAMLTGFKRSTSSHPRLD